MHLITNYLVPVALNRHEVVGAKGEAGDFFRSIYNQTQHFQYQGLWLVTPDGRRLADNGGPYGDLSRSPKAALAALQAGVKKFGTLSLRRVSHKESLPYRGVGVRPDGSVNLAVSDRPLGDRDLSRPYKPSEVIHQIRLGSVNLTGAEWSALAPPDVRVGSRWTIPESVGVRFYPLLDQVYEIFHSPKDVTTVELVGRVASERDGIAHLVYGGNIEGLHKSMRGEANPGQEVFSRMKMISGVGSYDIRSGQMLSLTWVWLARYADYFIPPYRGEPGRVASVLEWRRGDAKATARVEARAPGTETSVELADSTPEAALKTFLVALAAHDEAKLRAVSLPVDDLHLLLEGPLATPGQLARIKARLEEKPMRRLKAGDPVKMPDGQSRVIKPGDVRESRVVLLPDGLPIPSRVENVGGHWKVFAAPFIAARK
jgi:hypothetical protein